MGLSGRRRIKVTAGDVLLVNGYEMEAAMLEQITDPSARVLWAFIRSKDGLRIQPTPFSEEQCIWLTDADLVRSSNDV